MSTVAVVCSQHADEEWIGRVARCAIVTVDAASADVIVVSADCLDAVVEHLLDNIAIVVIGDPMTPYPRAAHVITRAWPDEHVRTLLHALAERRPNGHTPLPAPSDPSTARVTQRAIAAARKLASVTDLLETERTVVEILVELVGVDRGYCLFYDAQSGSLWSEVKNTSGTDERVATTGLAGFAARTGAIGHAVEAGEDPRFFGANDDPYGDRTDHVLAQPVLGSDGVVHAVFIVARRGKRPPFAPAELTLLARFAQVVTPSLDQLSIHLASQAILDENTSDDEGRLFRREAREAQAMARLGDVVRVSPGWLPWAYRLLVVFLVGSVAFAVLGTVSTYSTGVAVIRSTARTPVTARTGGNVVRVAIGPGDRVAVNDVLARLDDTEQRAAVDHLDHEFETQLRNHMLDPGDVGADASVRNLRHELDSAHTALDERLIRAPIAGVVGDVRVRPSQHIEPGDIVASVVDDLERLEVIALLPGADRPQLAAGMNVRFELNGYRYVYQTFKIDSVSADVLSPSEARRVLGTEVADSLQLTGPVALARGKLKSDAFVIDGRALQYHDGMTGTAEVRIRAEPIVYAIVPGMRRLNQ